MEKSKGNKVKSAEDERAEAERAESRRTGAWRTEAGRTGAWRTGNAAALKRAGRILVTGIMAASMVLGMTACGSSASAASSDNVLNIYVWTEYVPDTVIKAFEKDTGITVNESTFSTNEDMLAKVKSESEGAFDIVQPSDYMVKQMADQGMLEELKSDELTNLSNIGSQYLDQTYDPGNKYSVPYQGGVAGIAVNTDKVKDNITSYADLFDSKYKNQLVVLDDYRAIIGVAARSIGMSMNETDPTKLDQVKTQLLKLKDNVKLYDSDSPKSALISGDCTLGIIWSAEIALAMQENPSIKIVFPSEGAYKFMDNFCIPKGAKHYENAMKFINYMLKPESAEMVMAEYPYLNPNTVAVQAMGSDYTENEARNVPSDVISKAEFVENLDTDTLAIYDKMWTELKQ